MNIFLDFLVQYKLRIQFFCLLPSLPSHIGNSTELTEFSQFIPSSTDSMHTDVSGVGIDSVRTESVTTRSSRIGLGRFFKPCGLLGDSSGLWIRGLAYNISKCSALVAELWVVLVGLQLAWTKGYRRVQFEVHGF